MKKRGSAIVISMLLITAISVITFGIAKMIYAGSQTVQMYENGAVAYYSAESGIEEAFLRYRYNQNAQVPATNFKINQPVFINTAFHSLDPDGNPLPATISSSAGDGSDVNSLHQAYDLRMGYLGTISQKTGIVSPFYGVPTGDTTPVSFEDNGKYGSVFIKSGESVKINLKGFNLSQNDLNLTSTFFGSDPCRALIEAKFSIKENGIFSEYTEIIKPSPPDSCDEALNSKGITDTKTIPVGYSVLSNNLNYTLSRLQQVIDRDPSGNIPLLPSSGSGISPAEVTLYLKPLFYNSMIKLVSNSCSGPGSCGAEGVEKVPSGPYTYVQSTGYFGGIAKKLKANIDRQSGSLYDLFDYVIYTSN